MRLLHSSGQSGLLPPGKGTIIASLQTARKLDQSMATIGTAKVSMCMPVR
jgi:hypothetical protein